MLKEKLYDISLGQIEIFLTAANLKSFTKTAVTLNMTQSNVSKAISKLEKGIGIQLFVRQYRQIQLTEEGKLLAALWEKNLDGINNGYIDISRRIAKRRQTLYIGATNNTNLNLYFWPIIDRYTKLYEDTNIVLDRDNINRLLDKLLNGSLDVIFLPNFMKHSLEKHNMKWNWAAKDKAVIMLPADHPLAEQDVVHLADISSESFAVLDETTPDNERVLSDIFASRGYELHVGKRFSSPENISNFYTYKDGLNLTDKYFMYDYPSGHLVQKAVDDLALGIICAWDPSSTNKSISSLLLVAQDVLNGTT